MFDRANHRAGKIDPEDVVNMRREYAEGATQSSLVRKYGLSIGQVGRIVRNEAWIELPEVEVDGRYRNERVTSEGSIENSMAKLEELLSFSAPSPETLLNERCEHGVRRGQFCMECAQASSALDRLNSEIEKLTPETETRVANDLEEFLE